MINISELQSNIKNIEMICPFCFKYDLTIFHDRKFNYWIFYLNLLKKIYNENPKCSNNLNCLNLSTKWCTGCLNWLCENCSKTHLCDTNLIKEFNNRRYCYSHNHPKIYLNKNNINTSNKCPLHNKPYLFYCDYHENLCEECEDCDLPGYKKKYEFSHGECYFGPILNLQIKSKIKIIEEKIEKSINFFNTYILNLYNDNKDKYKNEKRKRFKRNFKIYKKNFVSFLEFILLLIKTSKKMITFSLFLLEIYKKYTFEYKKFEYDKNIKNKSLKSFNSQLSNYFSTQFFPIINNNYNNDLNNENNEKEIDVDLSKYNLNLILNNFNLYENDNPLINWRIKITEEEFDSLTLLEFNKNFFIEFDKNDLKYKNLLRPIYFFENTLEFYPEFKDKNGNIFLNINDQFFCIIEEKNNKNNKDKNIYKIIYLKSLEAFFNDRNLKKIKLITNNSIGLIFSKSIIILSSISPFSILKKIEFNNNYYDNKIKIFSLLYNPNIFIVFNNNLFLMQIYNKKNYQLISNVYGIFGDEILEINSNIILITYFAYEEFSYLMLVVDINKLNVLNCISFNLYNYHYSKKFKALNNPKFYLYSNQIEFLVINYPKFIKNNFFIKNDVQIKIFSVIKNVFLLKNDILAIIYNEGLIIESKNILIPYVKNICLTEDNNIIICFIDEIVNKQYISSIKVIKLKENGYEIIDSIKIKENCLEIVKISNNRFITYNSYDNVEILLWKLTENNSLEYLLKINELKINDDRIEEIFVLNKDIIMPKYRYYKNLNFWKIDENNKINQLFNINLNYSIEILFNYDNILFAYASNILSFININNYHIVKQIENFESINCMTKLLNGNILFGIKGKNDNYIIGYKFNKITCDLTKFKSISNAHFDNISKLLEMKNGKIISYEKNADFMVIWNRNNEFNVINN